MTIVIIAIILTILGVAASLYQLTAQSAETTEVIVHDYWWRAGPM